MARPKHKATRAKRRLVERATAGGMTQEEIAKILEITEPTLRKHYRAELDKGLPTANQKVIDTAFRLATDGKHERMTMFWLKTRLKWSERIEVEHSKKASAGDIAALLGVRWMDGEDEEDDERS